MTPIKDQLYCGSCYSFAATAVSEFYFLKKKSENLTLSQQNIIDCDNSNLGCSGGWPTLALLYIRDEGISEESSYGYEAVKQECRKNLNSTVHKIKNVCEVEIEDDEEKLKNLVANVGKVFMLLIFLGVKNFKFTQGPLRVLFM